MKLRFLIAGLVLGTSVTAASAQTDLSKANDYECTESKVEATLGEDTPAIIDAELTSDLQPEHLYALAQNVDDNELLRMYTRATGLSYDQLLAKAKKVRRNGWIIGGTCVVAGAIGGIILLSSNDYWTQIYGLITIGGGVIAGAAVTLGCNLYANSLQKKAYAMATYSAPIIEGDIMNLGSNKLTAGVSLMSNQYTHTKGLGMSLKLNF